MNEESQNEDIDMKDKYFELEERELAPIQLETRLSKRFSILE